MNKVTMTLLVTKFMKYKFAWQSHVELGCSSALHLPTSCFTNDFGGIKENILHIMCCKILFLSFKNYIVINSVSSFTAESP